MKNLKLNEAYSLFNAPGPVHNPCYEETPATGLEKEHRIYEELDSCFMHKKVACEAVDDNSSKFHSENFSLAHLTKETTCIEKEANCDASPYEEPSCHAQHEGRKVMYSSMNLTEHIYDECPI